MIWKASTERSFALTSLALGASSYALSFYDDMWRLGEPSLWPLALAGVGLVLGLVVLIARRGLGAALGTLLCGAASLTALPGMHSLHRPRWTKNQYLASAAVRTMISSAMAGDAACPTVASGCGPGTPGWEPFSPEGAGGPDSIPGYMAEFYLGPTPKPRQIETAGTTLPPVVNFAYYVRPKVPAGNGLLPADGLTGVLAFCGDSEGRLCSWQPNPDSPAPIQDGRCLVVRKQLQVGAFDECQAVKPAPGP